VERAFLSFAGAVAIFQNVPAVVPRGDLLDIGTPFAVLGTAALVLLALEARGLPLAVAFVAGIMYASGQALHLAANAIADEKPVGEAADVAYFYDERFGHIWWHLGWIGLLVSFCLAERPGTRAPRTPLVDGRRLAAAALLLGLTLFTNTVEGQTWWLGLGAAACFVVWAAVERRPLLLACALAFALDALFVAVWAIWHGGVPQFSDLGYI
jgi:hypothetical protein